MHQANLQNFPNEPLFDPAQRDETRGKIKPRLYLLDGASRSYFPSIPIAKMPWDSPVLWKQAESKRISPFYTPIPATTEGPI
jgi:hypothetical protein